jgi:hypothetical protein
MKIEATVPLPTDPTTDYCTEEGGNTAEQERTPASSSLPWDTPEWKKMTSEFMAACFISNLLFQDPDDPTSAPTTLPL